MPAHTSQSIDWYAEGEERIVEADGIQVVVRLVGRKGRRGADCNYGTARGGIPRTRPEEDRSVV